MVVSDDTQVKSTMNWDYRKSNTDYFNNNTKNYILKYAWSETRISQNKFLGVLCMVFKYLLLRAFDGQSAVFNGWDSIHPVKTADWQSKARNNKSLKTRERLKMY